ncbi:MAG TPA: BamA/TamA family outer membrane protein [Gemmatimonadales bacterium]|nr:BamA/TamA family outer membrane protein [Gemmatimonadales bacterium]
MTLRSLARAALAAALLPVPAAAQRLWKNTLYPYAYYSAVDGVWGAGHFSLYSPIGFVERPEANQASFAFDAAASTGGSYSLIADLEAPAYVDGWRLAVTVGAVRENRLGYYGVGNDAPYVKDSVTAGHPYFYRVSRSHQSARITLQRRVIGPLRLLAGGEIRKTDFRALPGGTQFGRDLASGAVDSTAVPFSDAVARGGLVLDTRDNELDPHSGVFVEGLYASGKGYTRTTASARAYLHPFEKLILAARLGGEKMGGSPPVAAEFTMESSEQPVVALGGYHTLRGYYDARFLGPGKLVAGAEARYALIFAPTLFELHLVAFYDAGRVFGPGESVRLTTSGLHSSGGAEIAARILRNAVLAAGVGAGSDGALFLFGTSWSY